MRTLRFLLPWAVVAAGATPARATYSIVARDAKTGELGVAVQSHWFAVGALVPWAEAGVGAVATQANVDPGYGPRALALLRAGHSAQQALAELLAKDPERAVRQVAIVDARGGVAVHTGGQTIAFAGHQSGTGFSVQANIMANAHVWPAMARAFEGSRGALAERLLDALDAAQAAGGDVRGMQSAAILVVGPAREAEPWRGVRVNLRIDDSSRPLGDLRRLYGIARAYDRANEGDALTAKKDFAGAAAAYRDAARLAPENEELAFWAALAQAAAGQIDEAAAALQRVFAAHAGWRALMPYLHTTDSPGVPILQKKLGISARRP
jgi:uncharacterized Ntn-hydrolase superfamily protein